MKREVLTEGLPAPGEPLQAAVAKENQAILDDELARRLERIKAKLEKKERKQLLKRQAELHKFLREYEWNRLVKLRWETWQEYEGKKSAYAFAETDEECEQLIEDGKALAARGKQINLRIDILTEFHDEYRDIGNRLKAHDDALAAEREDEENRKAFEQEAKVWQAQIQAVFRQSARLHHAYTDSDGQFHTIIPDIEHVYFKSDRVLFQIRTSAQNVVERMVGRWHSALPYNVDVSDLTCDDTLQNLSAACNRVVSVERSKRGTNFFYAISRLDAPDGIPEKVLYSKMIDWYPAADHAKTPWFAGVTQNRKVESYNFEEHPHILIAGTTKSGKSNHVNQMIATFVTMNNPSEVRLILVDLKGGIEFTHWQGIKHSLRPIIKRPSEVLPALQFLRSLMERRLATFETVKAKNLFSYNSKVPLEGKLPRLIFIIDELATLMELEELKAEIDKQLMVISSQGRAVGIHLLICTQRTSADVIPPWLKTNAGMMISGKMPNHHASMTILDSITAATLPDVRGRLVFSKGRSEVIAQSPLISDEEIERAVTFSKTFPDTDETEFIEIERTPLVAKPVFGREQLIDIALERFNGKLSPTRIHDFVGEKVATEREIKRLVGLIVEESADDGLEHRGQHYSLRKDRKTYVLEPIGQAIGQEFQSEPAIQDVSYSPIEKLEELDDQN